jgi:catechol 2,3-dioxygenase-like lactoylglutathione lyase family enzyme
MLHHLSFGVANLAVSTVFYDAVLAPLGIVRVWADLASAPDRCAVGYGLPGGGDRLALKQRPGGERLAPGPGFHLAFSASSHEAVQRFHEAALRHGGRDNGAPGLRPEYGADYYAAFVIDPDGYRLEAVARTPA